MNDLVNGWKNLVKGSTLTSPQALWVVGSAVLALIILQQD